MLEIEAVNAAVRTIDLSIPPPPYILCEERRLSRSNSRDQFSIATSPSSVDHNMNEMQALITSISPHPMCLTNSPKKDPNHSGHSSFTDPEDGSCSSKDTKSIADVAFTSVDNEESDQESTITPAHFPDKAVLDAPKTTRKRYCNDIDLHSVMSIELLEEEESESHEIMNRVTEMSKIVEDAQLYLQKDETSSSGQKRNGDLGLKSNDSLLFIPRHGEDYNNLALQQVDPMPSESEAESTPTNSPTHNNTAGMLATTEDEAKKMCSSFGLHSPHLFMSSFQQESTDEDIEELLRQLQTSTNLPFEEDTLCLDPDIIDLTIIPPPSDDVDFCCVTPDDGKSFLDQETGQRRDFYSAEVDSNVSSQVDSDEVGIVFSAQPDPSPETANNPADDDLSAYIIPPPPPSSSRQVEEQNRVLARFRQAAEEIRRMMAHGNDNPKYSDSMNSVSKFCTIPRRHDETHRPSLSSLASLVTPVRENHGKFGGSPVDEVSSVNGCAVDSETGVDWRPQPPPRVKRNSLVSMDIGSAKKDDARKFSVGQVSVSHAIREQTSQNGSPSNGHHLEQNDCDSQEITSSNQTTMSNGFQNGHSPHKSYVYNGYSEDQFSNGHDSDFYVNGEYNGYGSSEFQPSVQDAATECDVCLGGKNGLLNGCTCKKLNRFLSYHQSLPRKSMGMKLQPINGGQIGNGFESINGKASFQSAQQEIIDMIENLDLACKARLQECSECLPKPQSGDTKLVKVRDTLIYESRQFVTASKLFVKSITESSDKMEEHLTTCIALLDRIFAVSELVIMEMTLPSQINSLVEKLKEMAVAYSKTVQAAHSAASGEIPNSNMAGLMHQATSLATSLTVLMRTLRTYPGP